MTLVNRMGFRPNQTYSCCSTIERMAQSTLKGWEIRRRRGGEILRQQSGCGEKFLDRTYLAPIMLMRLWSLIAVIAD